MPYDHFLQELHINGKRYHYYDLRKLSEAGMGDLQRLPYSIRILVENLLRKCDGRIVREKDLLAILNWQKFYDSPVEIPYHPARVLMQDFTGIPAVVDLAAMRDAVRDLGGDPRRINPQVPVELIIDHSVQVDYFGTSDSLRQNVATEYERNSERYTLLKWAQKNFSNFKVVPPNSGICHQVNLEHLGRVVIVEEKAEGLPLLYPDTVVGLDSHTPMINGIGVMAWGVGGIEAEAVLLGRPYFMSIPEVIGVRLSGRLGSGITATDLVLTLTELLRSHRVVEKFVEFFGPGLENLSVPDRATVANMTPEFGATLGFFPIDHKTIEYLRITGRTEQAAITEAYARETGFFYSETDAREYSEILEFDLSQVAPCLAGPARPQDRIPLTLLKKTFGDILGCGYQRDLKPKEFSTFINESGSGDLDRGACHAVQRRKIRITLNEAEVQIADGSVVIAAITSCTNTSNPHVMIGAALMARNAVKKGLKVPAYVKTSLAPGSRVVSNYLIATGLMPYFEALGFHLTAFGCTTCIGNSGPLNPVIEEAIKEHGLNVAAVLSGNRNFEARIHQRVKSNFLGSPLLVLAFALAGRIDIDLTTEAIGWDPNGHQVSLADLWPDPEELDALVSRYVTRQAYDEEYQRIYQGDEFWERLPVTESTTYAWDPASTYIKKPPYFDVFNLQPSIPTDIDGARVLLMLGDSVTTDHISPAGAIPEQYPAGQYLQNIGVAPADFNSYGSRRGNHEVMMRGTFGNIRIKNLLISPEEGGRTRKFPGGEQIMYNYEAAMQYQVEGIPLVVLAGKEYGTGSSRDWAAKGSMLLGVKAVIAESFERIHRNNLVGMGVLPLVFEEGVNSKTLGLDGTEVFALSGLQDMTPRKIVQVRASKKDGTEVYFRAVCRLDAEVDVLYFQHGGILPYVLRRLMTS
jgi:aconitate hydratase